MILSKPFSKINLEDIQNLIDIQKSEDKYLEYKGEIQGADENRTINKAVCAFANANGGLFIYGVEEDENKIPTEIKGISLNNCSWDDKKRQIVSSINANIEPHIDVDLAKLDLDNEQRIVILINIPKSWNSPHCINKNNGKNRSFYIRRDGSSNPMEFEELKNMFDSNNKLHEKINEYRDERVSKFSSINKDKYKVIFHAIPFDAFSKSYINLKQAKECLKNCQFLHSYFFMNFDGLFSDDGLFKGELFRNGIFENILEEYRDDGGVNIEAHKNDFKKFIDESFKMYRELGISCPIVYFITFTNVKGRNMISKPGEDYWVRDDERDILDPSGVIIKNKNQIEQELHNIFVPILNHFGKDIDYIIGE